MDPTFEQLHVDYRQRVADTPTVRERVAETCAGLLLFAVCGVLWLVTPSHPAPDIWLLVALVVLHAAAWQVTFEVGAGATSPLQLVFVPMWFVVAPWQLPLVAAFSQVLGNLASSARAKDERHWRRALIGVPDAWYAVGPAAVLAAFGTVQASIGAWPILAVALAAEFFGDAVSGQLRSWAASGVRSRAQVRVMVWMSMVDFALAPIGLLVAILMVQSPWVLLSLIPLVGLLQQFAQERDQRILKALELSHAYRGTAQLMGDVLEADDAYTGGEHTQGVVDLSLATGRQLRLSATAMRDLEFGSLLHDVGKLRVPNEIINKPGKLTADEWAIIKQHPGYGQEMLERVGGSLGDAAHIVRAHHERWDGQGYPDGLAGDDIPIEARVITVCDSFSAMTTDRSYRRAMTRQQAIDELRSCAGSQFDPAVVDALEAALAQFPDAGGLAPVPDVADEPNAAEDAQAA